MCKSKRSKEEFLLFRVLCDLGFKSTTPLGEKKTRKAAQKGNRELFESCCGVSLVNTIAPRKKSEFDDVLDE